MTQGKITLEVLQAHDGVKNPELWTVLYDKVYDLTNFADKHPGGRAMIESCCGRDATALFESYHLYSETIAKAYLSESSKGSIRYVGEFDIESAKVAKQDNELPNDASIKFTFHSPLLSDNNNQRKSGKTNIYEIMKQRIIEQLVKNEQTGFKKQIRSVDGLRLVNTIFIVTGLLLCQFLSHFIPSISLGLAVIIALVGGLFHHLSLVHVVHDLGHGSYTTNPTLWKWFGNFYTYIIGQSFYIWTIRHNVGHHVYTNMSEIDPDVGVYEWNRHKQINQPQQSTPSAPSKEATPDLKSQMHANPKNYTSVPVDIMAKTNSFSSLPLLYASLIFYMQLVDFVHFWTRHVSEGITFATSSFSWTSFHFYMSKIVYVFSRLVLPCVLYYTTGGMIGRNPIQTLIVFVASEVVAGIMFGFLSQINHISEKCAWPSNVMNEMVDNSNEENGGNDDLDWAEVSLNTFFVNFC